MYYDRNERYAGTSKYPLVKCSPLPGKESISFSMMFIGFIRIICLYQRAIIHD